MRVMKFGGTSVRDAQRIAAVARLVQASLAETSTVVVVSALGGVTDDLNGSAARAAAGEGSVADDCQALLHRHLEAAGQLAEGDELAELEATIERQLEEVRSVLEGISLLGECSPRSLDQVLSAGELLSSQLVAAGLRRLGIEADACDARHLIRTDRGFGAARVDFERSYEQIRDHFEGVDRVQVVTGFLGSTEEGETATLGRGGSDYTASLLGAALMVDRIEIWTDVDGVLSCDPRRVPDAFTLEALSYDELLELSHFGAKVVYPPTVHPARAGKIPLVIRNTMNPDFPGTLVTDDAAIGPHPIRGISAISRVSLLLLEGDGLARVPGIARRLFSSLARANINVILISQASSEHSICLAIDPKMTELARERVNEEFASERGAGLVDDLDIDEDVAIVAVVGAGMAHRPGISGRLFSALGEAGVNVRAIAQGSSELNISFAVASADETRVLRLVHSAFFDDTNVHLFLAGVGGVGGALLEQLRASPEATGWSLSGVANSRRLNVDRKRSRPSEWLPDLAAEGEIADSDALVAAILETPGRRVFLDCTADDTVGNRYPTLLEAGVSVVTANKKPLAGSRSSFREILDAQRGNGRLFYEATAGAGLPVVGTLQDLVATGDRIESIEGLFSGTLGYLCSHLREGRPLSEIVREAHRAGYTEPDPRDDLSGMDVARKLLILARTAGASLEIDDIEIVPLLDPARWGTLDLDAFWERLPSVDEEFASRQAAASERGAELHFLAHWSSDGASVGLVEVGPDHPCFGARGTDNLFAFATARYPRPLVVRGAGAGPEVTAAGMFAELRRALGMRAR